jgi:hypothetical protein
VIYRAVVVINRKGRRRFADPTRREVLGWINTMEFWDGWAQWHRITTTTIRQGKHIRRKVKEFLTQE